MVVCIRIGADTAELSCRYGTINDRFMGVFFLKKALGPIAEGRPVLEPSVTKKHIGYQSLSCFVGERVGRSSRQGIGVDFFFRFRRERGIVEYDWKTSSRHVASL